MEESNFSENKTKKWRYIFIATIIFLIGLLFFQLYQERRNYEIRMQYVEEKNSLRDDLDDLIDEHDGLLDEYGELNNQLYTKDSIIQNQISEIRDLIRTKDNLIEAKRKIVILKEIARRYLSNIDSLLVVNENLVIEKDSVIKENRNINWKNYRLSKQNEKLAEKVSKGSVLKILSIDVKAIRYRNTGKEVSTRFAKKAQKVKVCFTIGANQISDSEEKIVFMQLINAKGKLIKGKEGIEVSVSDSIFNCTTSSTFSYKNIEMNNCFEWERTQQLESGSYFINLIIEGRIAAQENLKLR
jgi:hypothetical protein